MSKYRETCRKILMTPDDTLVEFATLTRSTFVQYEGYSKTFDAGIVMEDLRMLAMEFLRLDGDVRSEFF